MTATADGDLFRRHTVMTRLRGLTARTRGNRLLVLGVACVGLLITFGAMVAIHAPARIGSIWLLPWVAMIAAELGPVGGAASGGVAAALYLAAVEMTVDPDDSFAFFMQLAALVGIGLAAGYLSRRISSDALELQSTSALQEALLDSTVDGICLTDVSGHIVLSNSPLQRFGSELGLPVDGTVAERLLVLADRTTEPARFRKRMRELSTDLAASEDEFELAESGRVFRGYTAPVLREDASVVGRIWTLREVTADRRLERLRDAFLAAVSHELRTPLTSMSGFVELLAEEPDLGPAARKYVDVIRRGNDRLRRIIEDLLLVAEIEAERLELRLAPTDLADLAAAAVEAALPAAERNGIELSLDAERSLPLEADDKRLRKVLDNLVSNALKFTPRGGSVHVAASNEAGSMQIEVIDTGIGVPPDELGQLFSRFYRASTAKRHAIPGTGLGLVIARAIVEAHGGSISLCRRERRGTRVIVTLPGASA